MRELYTLGRSLDMTKKNMRAPVSVCMATFNGEKYIRQQIESILMQLEENDELVIIDDCSIDTTTKIISSVKDPRIVLHENIKNIGQIRTFELCISNCKFDIIFFSDQDDIWEPDRLDSLRNEIMKNKVDLVASNMMLIDANGKQLNYLRLPPLVKSDSRKNIKNLTKIFFGNMGYFGCTMAFRRPFLDLALPMPRNIESHDLWFSICANLNKSIVHFEPVTLKHRVHGNNTSIVKRSLFRKLFSRILLLQQVIIAKLRILKAEM